MIDNNDIKELEERFDLRYKLLADCNTEMDEVKKACWACLEEQRAF